MSAAKPTLAQAVVLRALAAGRWPDSIKHTTKQALARRGWVTLSPGGFMTITDAGRVAAPELAESMADSARVLTNLLTNQFPTMVWWEASGSAGTRDLPHPSELAEDVRNGTGDGVPPLVADLRELREMLPARPKHKREWGDDDRWRATFRAIDTEISRLVAVKQFDAIPDKQMIALHDAIDLALKLIADRALDDTLIEKQEKAATGIEGEARGKSEGEIDASKRAVERLECSRPAEGIPPRSVYEAMLAEARAARATGDVPESTS